MMCLDIGQTMHGVRRHGRVLQLSSIKKTTLFIVSQVKQKEQDMKEEYRVVKDLSGESGFSWDSDRKMVTAPNNVWESLGARRNKEALLQW
jgi:hypothetical protein